MESDIGSVHSSQSYVVEEVIPASETIAMENETTHSDTPLQPKEEVPPANKDDKPVKTTTINTDEEAKKMAITPGKSIMKTGAVLPAAGIAKSSWLGLSSDTWFWMIVAFVTIIAVTILYLVQRWWSNKQTAERDAHRKKIREEMQNTIVMDLEKEKLIEPMPTGSGNLNAPGAHRTVVTKPQQPGTILTAIPKVAAKAIETPAPKGFDKDASKKVTFPKDTTPKTASKSNIPKSILKPSTPVVVTEEIVKEVDKVIGTDGSWTQNDVKQCIHGVQLEDATLKSVTVESKIHDDCSKKPNLVSLIGSVFATPMVVKSSIPKDDSEPSKIEEINDSTPIASVSEQTGANCEETTCPIPKLQDDQNKDEQVDVSPKVEETISNSNEQVDVSPNEEKDENLKE